MEERTDRHQEERHETQRPPRRRHDSKIEVKLDDGTVAAESQRAEIAERWRIWARRKPPDEVNPV
ncbi:hypothetical protein [Salinigranum salinum]|uniref:hypothetical protein n=1 Tax=Salinigranum salinum TaxID=1364937 RepID=UPI0012604509|nr:hypothetical protein [Salinigranum salinum]